MVNVLWKIRGICPMDSDDDDNNVKAANYLPHTFSQSGTASYFLGVLILFLVAYQSLKLEPMCKQNLSINEFSTNQYHLLICIGLHY